MHGSIRWFVASLVFVGLTATASVGKAEDPEALIKQGVELRRKGDNVRAEVYMRRAYQLAQTPRSAAQLGLVELALGRFDKAEQYLSEALTSDDFWIQEHRVELEHSRAQGREHLARVEVVGAPDDATWTQKGAKPEKLASDGVAWLTPGPIELTIDGKGRKTTSYSGTLAAGQSAKVAMLGASTAPPPASAAAPSPMEPVVPPLVAPEAAPPEPAPSAPQVAGEPGRKVRLAGIAVGSVGLVTAVTGFVLYEIGGSKLNHIESGTTYDTADGNWQTFDHAGVGLLVGGGVAVAAGSALYAWGRHLRTESETSGEPPGEPRVSIGVTPGSRVVTLGGAF